MYINHNIEYEDNDFDRFLLTRFDLQMTPKYPPSNYPGGVGATHFVRGPTPHPTKWVFLHYKMATQLKRPTKWLRPAPPWPEQTLGKSCQHFF